MKMSYSWLEAEKKEKKMEENSYVKAIFERIRAGESIDKIYAEFENLLFHKANAPDLDMSDFEQLSYAVDTLKGYLAAEYMRKRGWVMNENNSSPMWKRGEVQ